MLIRYARVSTKEQHESLEAQVRELEHQGCQRVFTDVASGAKASREGLDAACDYARDGDTILVTRLDRLGRTMLDTLRTLKALDDRQIRVKALDLDLDTGTPSGKLVVHVVAALAEWERDILRERTREGLEHARRHGRMGGRPPAMKPQDVIAARAALDAGLSMEDVARMHGVSRWTVRRYVDALNDEAVSKAI